MFDLRVYVLSDIGFILTISRRRHIQLLQFSIFLDQSVQILLDIINADN